MQYRLTTREGVTKMNTYNKHTEVSMIAYSGKSRKTAKAENFITGTVQKVTKQYIWILSYADNQIWKAVR
jgi:hypothetical protein